MPNLIHSRDFIKYPPRFKIGDIVYYNGERATVCGVIVNGSGSGQYCYPVKNLTDHSKADSYYLVYESFGRTIYKGTSVADEDLQTPDQWKESQDS
jgi:hypothetical protein